MVCGWWLDLGDVFEVYRTEDVAADDYILRTHHDNEVRPVGDVPQPQQRPVQVVPLGVRALADRAVHKT